ncbi:MAG: M15 family metallopeptidase [Flavobacteriales bacterium]|jgi:D-alanyl-D-alanine carboxypeptidase
MRYWLLVAASVLCIWTPSYAEKKNLQETSQFVSLVDTSITYSMDDLLGKFEPARHKDFTLIASSYTSKQGIYLRTEAYLAFQKMHAAALKEGVTLTILSATRNYQAQKAIWERKWKRPQYEGKTDVERTRDILKYSSMPGTSRHHWGTDIDINSLEPAYFKSGQGLNTYQWLVKNGPDFGFYQTYTSKSTGRTGYEEEAWHWSYMPIAKPMLNAYVATISYSDIVGFSGCSSAKDVRIIEDFVNGIDPTLLK